MLGKIIRFKMLKKHFSATEALLITIKMFFTKKSLKVGSKNIEIHFRKGTKDFETFEEIFLSSLYNIPLPFVPKTIVDAGANIGLASVFFNLKYPNAEIVAIEIEKSNIAAIQQNTKHIQKYQLLENGLFNRKSFFKIEDPYNATNSFQIKEVEQGQPYDIESVTLDEILTNKNWETIDVLKIDIEGAEKELFESNYETWIPKTKVIMVETHDRMREGCSKSVTETLNKYNFMLYTTTEGTLIYFNPNWVNLK